MTRAPLGETFADVPAKDLREGHYPRWNTTTGEWEVGGTIARPGTPGEPAMVSGTVKGPSGKPIAGAVLDVWQSSGEGFYDVQQSGGTNLRGKVRTGADGKFRFRTVLPVSYPVPTDGPVGKMLKATGRHPMRPGASLRSTGGNHQSRDARA